MMRARRLLVHQTDDVIAATESLNKVAGTFAASQATLDKALKTVPEALAVLNNERENLVAAADALGKFSQRVVGTVDQSKASLVKELKEIGPVLESLANAGLWFPRDRGGFPMPLPARSWIP